MYGDQSVPVPGDAVQVLPDSLTYAAHGYDDVLRVGRAMVVEEAIGGPQARIDLGELAFHDFRQGQVIGIGGFPCLEEDIGILGRAIHLSVGGMEGALPDAMVRIPTNIVNIFVEKIPIDYNVTYADSGQAVSKEGASRDLPANRGIGMYQGEKRWILMSRLYYWAQEFQKMYPDEMEVYLETDNLLSMGILTG